MAITSRHLLEGTALPNGAIKGNFNVVKSLMHQLTHAAETKVLGRQMLYYVRRVLKSAPSSGLKKGGVPLDPMEQRRQIVRAAELDTGAKARFGFVRCVSA